MRSLANQLATSDRHNIVNAVAGSGRPSAFYVEQFKSQRGKPCILRNHAHHVDIVTLGRGIGQMTQAFHAVSLLRQRLAKDTLTVSVKHLHDFTNRAF